MVAILFARRNSVYRALPGLDIWDEARDARNYAGADPVVAHPPCRGWGRYRHRAKVQSGETDLALFAVDQVRRCGGVLEHPAYSALWDAADLPCPGWLPLWGEGFTVALDQAAFGHRGLKPTWLYVVGIAWADLPPVPQPRSGPLVPVEHMCRAERERTPEPFARWLVQLASTCRGDQLCRK